MQTFLPYPDFTQSAQVLDNKRLGKQRLEAIQILMTLRDGSKWQNHPAVIMWKGFEHALADYLWACVIEWKKRGFENTIDPEEYRPKNNKTHWYPEWWGHWAFHRSHRVNLYKKYPEYYRPLFDPNEDFDENLPYLWPTTKDFTTYRDSVFYIVGAGLPYVGLWVDYANAEIVHQGKKYCCIRV